MNEPFISAIPIINKLEASGFQAYFVGGSVRDYLLNRPISDVDIATSATPNEVKEIFSRTVDIGIEHGTVLVLYQNRSYEVTTFRTEGEYQDYRRPKEVSFIRILDDDLKRRDFTMNAIAMDRNGQLIDPFNGQAAIQNKVIQTVGSAKERFQEDALRIMRAVRFVSQLSFAIEEETLKALTKLVPLLKNIAVERIRAEFEKMLVGENGNNAIRILLETQLYAYLPGLKNHKSQLEKVICFPFKGLNKLEMWSLLLFTFLIKDKAVEVFLREWKLPVKEIKEIQQILIYLEKRMEREWLTYDLYSAGRNAVSSTEKLYGVLNGHTEEDSLSYWLKIYDELPIKQRNNMDVTGSDIIEWFQSEGGPWLKDTLLKIECAILAGDIQNDKEKIKEWLIRCSQK
ncbi:CCA tRNA nucleotidyltransferase [Bacillus sp. AFS076308]|uniref:CCA tRNA nucleotidyltransferase n=1 Tax=unclassified Bacillus (in: firmicutes) TaxID=185979 RepID=UPI000BF9E6C6|nr:MULTISPECIES: CCA tRNA nucleotidyltransferase [unclassified Bacillus (in: firmicutes)]PFO02435.1 CCA tRNA nucleotidyltransferase [Bacillus sp. AFS076308]PGV55658.1 CCA tRNA nucleotidyltransferase [Bacillus sp. AFS037270]